MTKKGSTQYTRTEAKTHKIETGIAKKHSSKIALNFSKSVANLLKPYNIFLHDPSLRKIMPIKSIDNLFTPMDVFSMIHCQQKIVPPKRSFPY